jgi:hypothetical protein
LFVCVHKGKGANNTVVLGSPSPAYAIVWINSMPPNPYGLEWKVNYFFTPIPSNTYGLNGTAMFPNKSPHNLYLCQSEDQLSPCPLEAEAEALSCGKVGAHTTTIRDQFPLRQPDDGFPP